MKKIMLFCPIEMINGYKGGIATIVESYFTNLDFFNKLGYQINFCTGDQQLNMPKGFINKIHYHISYVCRFKKFIAKHKDENDLIHIHSSRDLRLFEDLLIALYAKRKCKIPIVVTIHRSELNKTITNNKIIQFVFLCMMNKVDKVVFLSEHARRQFEDRNLRNTAFLPNFHSYEKSAKSKSFDYGKEFHLLFVGFYNKEKGLVELIEAMKRLPHDIVLDICGGKKDGNSLEIEAISKELGTRIINHGYVTGHEKESVFEKADVFILPSYGEGMPLVILEALHFGLPIITTPVGSIPEVLVENKNALFIQKKNVNAIITAVLALKNNRELIKYMRFNNAKLSEEYCIESNIKNLCDIYSEICGK